MHIDTNMSSFDRTRGKSPRRSLLPRPFLNAYLTCCNTYPTLSSFLGSRPCSSAQGCPERNPLGLCLWAQLRDSRPGKLMLEKAGASADVVAVPKPTAYQDQVSGMGAVRNHPRHHPSLIVPRATAPTKLAGIFLPFQKHVMPSEGLF